MGGNCVIRMLVIPLVKITMTLTTVVLLVPVEV